MLYLNSAHINTIGLDWQQLTTVIGRAIMALSEKDYSQPVKPYLRYSNPKNRIIAMPAYIGGEHPYAGIKWIASFPDNIHQNRLRANSVTVLNEYNTGIPICMINTSGVSAIRTAAVSGLMVKEYLATVIDSRKLTVGIIGFGPIGQMHLKMMADLFGDRVERFFIYDLKPVDITAISDSYRNKVILAESWEKCYDQADIFITCTVSTAPYINRPPVRGSLQLNVSLRDYTVEMKDFMDVIIVDNWEEVCRENTDIENMNKYKGLSQQDTVSITDVVCSQVLKSRKEFDTVMFNPMGMAIFDIAIGGYYYREGLKRNIGNILSA